MICRNHRVIKAVDASAVDACRQAIEEGEMWIRLDLSSLGAADADEVAEAVVAECKASGVILTFVDDLEGVERMRVHGLHLTCAASSALRDARQRLGANAVIGADVTSAFDGTIGREAFLSSEADRLRALDIDYLSFEGNDYLIEDK